MAKKRLALNKGQQFGTWIVGDRSITHRSSYYWCRCTCDSGTIRAISASTLVRGISQRCVKCRKSGKDNGRWTGVGDLPGRYWTRLLSNARRRDLEVNITIHQAWELFQEQDAKCAETGWELQFGSDTKTTASLDRIDPSKHYDLNNVQWVHKTVNRCKWVLTSQEFRDLCRSVYLKYNKV
jgi:hypothetical protein